MDNAQYSSDQQFQQQILVGVSRTFAITIPQLPMPLREVVSNAYLLCRIADTIEDDAELSMEQKKLFHQQFIQVVSGESDAQAFADELTPLLSERTLAAERELIEHTTKVIRLTHSYSERQQAILLHTIQIMCQGMPIYERTADQSGLERSHDLDKYCYYVAGVVGEMLTELFCDYSAEIAQHRTKLRWLSVSFGQALQMTNILKDIWDDYSRGVCWLPKEVFQPLGIDLANLPEQHTDHRFALGMEHLVSTAMAHCRNALVFTSLIPSHEKGIRRFCLRALFMAVLTLRKIYEYPCYSDKRQVTITRRAVKTTLLFTNLLASSDKSLLLLFRMLTNGLPQTHLSAEWEPSGLSEFAIN